MQTKVTETKLLFVVPGPQGGRRNFVVPYFEDKILVTLKTVAGYYDVRIRRGSPVYLDTFEGTVPTEVHVAGMALVGVSNAIGHVLESYCEQTQMKPPKTKKPRTKTPR